MKDPWYVFQEGHGPMGRFGSGPIISGIRTGNIKADTRVSREGKSGWHRYRPWRTSGIRTTDGTGASDGAWVAQELRQR